MKKFSVFCCVWLVAVFAQCGWAQSYRSANEGTLWSLKEPTTEKHPVLPSVRERIEEDNVRSGFFQKIDLKETFLDSFGGRDRFGMSTTELTGTFALPLRQGKGYWLLQPWFTQTYWYETPEAYRYAGSLFQTGISLGWMKEFNERWNMFAFFAPNYSGDYHRYASQGFRFPGGVVMDWKPNDEWKVSFGVVYTAWEQWAILPYGGVTWIPNEDWKWEIVLPRPRICRRLNSVFSENRFWVYLAGEYGGGIWNVEVPALYEGAPSVSEDLLSYRDLRWMIGIENDKRRIGTLDWSAEAGMAFCRKMNFDRSSEVYRPDPGLLLRFRLTY